MKKVFQGIAIVSSIALLAYILYQILYIGILGFEYLLNNPLYTMLYILGMLTLLYIYYKLRDWYRRR